MTEGEAFVDELIEEERRLASELMARSPEDPILDELMLPNGENPMNLFENIAALRRTLHSLDPTHKWDHDADDEP